MSKTRTFCWKFIVICGALALLTLGNRAAAITIDGGFDDWSSIAPLSTGEPSESIGDGTPAGNDIVTVWATSDQANLYLSVQCADPLEGSGWGPTFVVIDMDRTPGTGFRSGVLGVDILVQPRSDLSGELMIHHRVHGADDNVWSRWESPAIVEGGYRIGGRPERNRVEMRIPWKELGVDNPDQAAFRFRICDSSQDLNPDKGDWVPNGRRNYFAFAKGSIGIEQAKAEPKLRLAHVWSDKPLAKTGDTITFSAFVESIGDTEAADVALTLTATPGVATAEAMKAVAAIPVGSYRRVDWSLKAEKPGAVSLNVAASAKSISCEPASYKILVIDREAKYTRQELCTDADGYWRLLERPRTLQQENTNALTPVNHKKSSEIKHSPYGICAHLPRSKDYEAPFDPSHLIDGDPQTCWSSQQNASSYPGVPPWAEIDLGKVVTVERVNLIPYWHNTDFPAGFSIRASADGKTWDTVLQVSNYQMKDAGEKRGDKNVQAFALSKPVQARRLRIEFERLPLSGGNYAEVSQGYKARLSGIEVIDDQGANAALLDQGASVQVSDVFTGWQNTARTVNESFERIFDIGLKWVRVGQWGDQTEWAAVEREKGKLSIDPVCDAGIRKLLDSGVDILYGLNYGNALYEPRDTPHIDVGPIYTEGHPFYKNGGPRTEEGRQAFVRYVDFVVRKYGDRIKWWELWNEENGWYPGHEPELYGKLLHAVAKHIKEINPDLKVMFGGTAAPAPITTEIALREGGAPYVDAYAFHPYGIDKPEGGMGTMEVHQGKNLGQTKEETGWKCLEDIVAGVRKPFAQHGRPDVEVWLNEWGTNVAGLDFTYKPGGYGEYACAKSMMRFYVYSGWLKLPTAWWALYNENKSQDWGILEQSGYGFRPMSYALQNVCSVVSDVQPVRPLDYKCDGPAPDLKVISYRKDGTGDTLVAIWAAEMPSEEVKSYPSKLAFSLDSRPKEVVLTDLYWGVSQAAGWSYENGILTIDQLIVRDYPIVITCERD